MHEANSNAVDERTGVLLGDLVQRAGLVGSIEQAIPEVCVRDIADDSRLVKRGTCFVAVRGVGADGHRFIPDAVARGASVVFVEDLVEAPGGVSMIRVRDTRLAVAKLAAAYYGLRTTEGGALRLVGITGTNGKTTIGWLLRAILNASGHRTAMLGTVEYDLVSDRTASSLTTPGPVELCRVLGTAAARGATYGVMEVSSHALDQRRCHGLAFAAGVYSNLTGDHLDYHGTMDQYASAKRRLFDLLGDGGIAVVNADDAWCDRIASGVTGRVLEYAIDARRADYSAQIEAMTPNGNRFAIVGPSINVSIRSALVGRHNVLNVLAAATTALGLGISVDAVVSGIESVDGVPGRLQRADPPGHPYSVLIDYAHTDDALRNVLTAVRGFTKGRVLCVFGCGGDRDRTKRPRMARAVSDLADVAFVTSDNPRTEDPNAIIHQIVAGFDLSMGCRLEVDSDRRRAIGAAIAEAQPGDTVLIAGKGHETYQIIGDRVLPFDDVIVAREFLSLEGQLAGNL